jgi:TetR/AcrR family transcriptional repressor of nem operon
MARSVNEKEYAVKRNEILDVAQRFVYTNGYEQMAIQDILDELQISKGAFYHYFDSKQDLLEALIDRILEEMERLLTPIVHDPHLSALEKLQRFFASLAYFKTERKAFLLALLRVWYKDENAIVRQKVRADGNKLIAPMLTFIVCQGIQEGVLTPPFPEQAGEVVLSIAQGLQDTLGELILFSHEPEHQALSRIEITVAAYSDAFEHVLGIPKGSFSLVDAETLKEWFVSSRDVAQNLQNT